MAQSTSRVFMIRPQRFGYNPQTAQDNTFQQEAEANQQETIAQKALEEFDGMVSQLREAGVDVKVFEENMKTPGPTPDVVFPNNWISTHQDGSIIIYPMRWENRQWERRSDIIKYLKDNFKDEEVIDASPFEDKGLYLEGTGSMVLDHDNQTIYAAISERTNERLVEQIAAELGYDPVAFQPNSYKSENGTEAAIYHTNVLMGIGSEVVIICMDAIADHDRDMVKASLHQSGKEIIEITTDQMIEGFCGNILEVKSPKGKPYMLMSTTAHSAFTEQQKQAIQQHNQILHFDISTIERYGGGSVRCMVAQNFLSPR